ncbi:ORF6N domain-containing protein [Prevotella sp. AM42-24]|uniref:ORF6N domain-containing protein n=1 Tax=Prevotella sp. AM42-24 TaxID=2293125 RepID=UPI001F2B8CBA|nr:ORF6N domain-containing protein [Prevotella sp. AM42-24]
MTDITEKTENGELVTNCDQLVVMDNIESLIKVIRGQQVMLDKDLATLYGVETRTLNQAVKRNIQRFPSDFRFQLTMEECSKSQIEEYHSFREI